MTPGQTSRYWALAIVPIGLFAMFAPYLSKAVGLPVPVAPKVEVVDHIVPGVATLGAAASAVLLKRLYLPAALLATLAGFWMTSTHLPLLLQAQRDEVGWSPALIHSVGGILVLVISLVGSAIAWREDQATL